MTVNADTMAVNLREGGLPQVRIYVCHVTGDGLGDGTNIDFDEPMFDVGAERLRGVGAAVRAACTTASWVTPDTVLDYDPRDRRAARPQAEADARRLRPCRLRADPRVGRPPVTARRSRSRSSTTRTSTPRSQTPLLLYGYGSYETATTRSSASRGYRCSTAAWSTCSRTSAAAARWGGSGTSTGSCWRRRTPSPTSSTARSTSSTPVGPPRTRWSGSAEAPAGC